MPSPSDDDIGGVVEPGTAQPAQLTGSDPDLIARAAIAEGDKDNAQSWQNVAGVVYNRMRLTGKSAAQVLSEPHQFESYANGSLQKVDPTSPTYQAAMNAIQPVLQGTVQVPYDTFYQPDIVKARGVTPPFPAPKGTRIGTQLFGSGFYKSPDDEEVGGVLEPRYVDAQGNPLPPGSPKPTTQDAETAGFLTAHGFRDESATPGSSTNPIGIQPAQTPDSAKLTNGQWYLQSGKLRQVGDPTDDFMPQYQHIVALRQQIAKQGGWFGSMATGVAQGLADVGQSANKLTGGALEATGGMLTGQGFNLPQMAQQGLQSDVAERNQFNLAYGDNPLAKGARFVGQFAPVTAATMGTGDALGALGPAGDFLAGGGQGALRVPSAVASTALQGAEAAGLTSSTSDQPLGQQLAQGAEFGGGLGLLGSGLRGGANALMRPSANLPPMVSSLADKAINDYGIPLRAGQIRAAAGDRAAGYADSNLLGSEPEFQENNAVQHGARMQAITGAYGDTSGDISPSALSDAQARIVGVMGDVAGRTTIQDAKSSIAAPLDAIVQHADAVLGDDDLKPLQKLVANIKSTIGPDGTMSGQSWRALTQYQSQLQSAIRAGKSDYPAQIYGVLQDALTGNAPAEDVDALANARWQYKNWVAVSRAAPQAKLGVIPPGALKSAVNQTFASQATMGAGPLGDIRDIDQAFMKEPPQSGTVPRGADLLHNIPWSLLGGEGAAVYFHNPLMAGAAVLPYAAGKLSTALKKAQLGPEAGAAMVSRGSAPGTPVNPLWRSVTSGAVPASVLLTQPAGQ